MSRPLGGGSPRRLLHQAGKWVLEVVRDVNVAPGLSRPTTQRLSGNRVIASYFTSNPDKAVLGNATRRLMQASSGSDPRSYAAVGGDWVVNSMPPARGDSLDSYSAPALTAALETQVAQLRARIALLTVAQENTLVRLAGLEAKHARGSWSADRGPDSGVSSSRGSAFESDRTSANQAAPPSSSSGSPRAPNGDSMPSDDARELAAHPEPSAGRAPDAVAPAAVPLATPPAVRGWKELELPSVSELAQCIAMLVGSDVSAHEGSPLAVTQTTRDCYGAAILDDSDQTIGLILMDLKATVYLGGTLMMLPKAEMDLQLKTASPSPDAIAASSEISNTLSGAINGGAQSQHVRMGPLDKFAFESWSWVTKPAHRRDLQDSLGGRTVVFSR